MVKVIYIPCLFEDQRYEFESRNLNLTSVFHSLLKKYPEISGHSPNITIRINGKKIHPVKWAGFPLKDGDMVLILQDVGFTAIVAILGVTAVEVSALGVTTTLGVIATVLDVVLSVAYMIYSYATVDKPSYGSQGQGLANSPTYGWDGIQMQIRTGIPIPVVYGEHLVGGNLIACFISTNGDKNYLNMLIALSEGEIEGIMKQDLSGVCSSVSDDPYILINDNFLSNFQGVSWDYRLGTQDQDPIAGFHEVKSTYGTGGTKITSSGFIHTTVDSDIEAFELRFRVPALWNQYEGNFFPRKITYHVYHQVYGESEWTDDGTVDITASTRNPIRRYWRKDGLTANRYDIKVVLVTAEPDKTNSDGDLYLDYVVEIKYDSLSYPHTALLALKILATEQLSGQIPNVLTLIRGIKSKNLETSLTEWTRNAIYNVNNLIVTERYGAGRYIQQSHINNDQLILMAQHCDEMVGDGTKRGIDAVTSTSLTDDDYTFLEGDVGKTICCKSPNDGTIYSKMIVTSLTGDHQVNGSAGWSDGTPELSAGWEFGEKRYELDIVLDSQGSALDMIQQVCASFRGMPIWIKDAIQIGIDKKESPCYPFNMGNVLAKSFKHNYVSEKNKPNVIQITFADRDKKFAREPIEIPDSAAITGGAPRRTRQLSLIGASRRSQIYREGRFHLYAAKYQDEQIYANGGIDAIHLLPFDVIKFQHNSPQWGFGGRIIAATINTITLDQEVQIEAGNTYVATVRQPDTGGAEKLETRTVTNGAGYYNTLNVTPDFSSIPATWGLYLFGKQGVEGNPFRLMRVGMTPRLEVGFLASKYSDQVYVDTDLILPEPEYSALPNPVLCPQVTNVSVTEGGIVLGDGTWAPFLEVGFKKPELPELLGWSHAEIYIQLIGVEEWFEYYGKTEMDHGYKIENHAYLKIGNTVKVKVVAVTKNGIKAAFDSAPSAQKVISGKTTGPSDIESFTAIQYGDKVIMEWSAPTEKDISHYEIREGADWNVSQIIGQNIYGTTFNWFTFSTGLKNLLLKAVDRHGNYSENPAETEIDINISPSGTPLAEMDGLISPTLNNTLKQYAMFGSPRVIGLIPTLGWDDGGYWDDGSKWDIPVSPLTGDLITSPIDFGKIGKVLIIIDDNYVHDGDGQTAAIEIATSENGSDYTSWTTFISGEYFCRYVKFKITLTTDNENENIFVTKFKIKGTEVGATTLRFENQAIAVGGTTINYGMTFLSKPTVQVTSIATSALIVGISSKTNSSCLVQLFNTSGTDVGGNADITVEGQ
jgi:predicted phage tail protein